MLSTVTKNALSSTKLAYAPVNNDRVLPHDWHNIIIEQIVDIAFWLFNESILCLYYNIDRGLFYII